MELSFGCELHYQVVKPTLFIFNIEAIAIPAHGGLQASLNLNPNLPRDAANTPPFGNRYTRVMVPPGPFSAAYSGSADLQLYRADPATIPETPLPELPLELFPYIQASRFAESDVLGDFAKQQFAALDPGFSRVTAICNWIADNVEYRRGASDEQTTAAHTLNARAGVCRDFAHLGISFCRALGIPARFVSCYALGLVPADFHAVFEAYLGGQWWLFDPTRQAALDGLVRIGAGRDAADVAFASIYGEAEATGMRVWINAADPNAATGQRTSDAVRST